MSSVGQVLFAFFEDHLQVQKGLRPGSVRSYRDTIKLFLAQVATSCRRPVTRLTLHDLSSERVLEFLSMIESVRKNHVRTRNQRLAALRTFYRYLAVHHPEVLAEAERVEAIPTKRTPPPETHYLERMRSTSCSKRCPSRAHSRCATEHSSCFSTIVGHGCRKLPTCGLAMLSWRVPCACGFTAKGTSGEVALSGRRRRKC
jgi:Phage integrase, N-terminal SAM-like domain